MQNLLVSSIEYSEISFMDSYKDHKAIFRVSIQDGIR